jgi:hypothetical protein
MGDASGTDQIITALTGLGGVVVGSLVPYSDHSAARNAAAHAARRSLAKKAAPPVNGGYALTELSAAPRSGASSPLRCPSLRVPLYCRLQSMRSLGRGAYCRC